MKDDEPHDVRHFQVGDGRSRGRTARDGGGRRKTTEISGSRRRSGGDGGGLQGTTGDCGGRHNIVRPRPEFLLVGDVKKKTGWDDQMSSVLVLA